LDPSFVIWLTGLPSSGKTTIAESLKPQLIQVGFQNIELLDGDIVRKELSPDLGFTKEDRDTHARRVIYLCKLLSRNGIPTIVSLISPYRELRSFARNEMSYFIEVYVKCSLETCIKRDRKGLYRKALNGEIKDLTGLQDPYEEPANPELIANTEEEHLDEIVNKIILKIKECGYLQVPRKSKQDYRYVPLKLKS
jgi:adenylylsulfate kinase